MRTGMLESIIHEFSRLKPPSICAGSHNADGADQQLTFESMSGTFFASGIALFVALLIKFLEKHTRGRLRNLTCIPKLQKKVLTPEDKLQAKLDSMAIQLEQLKVDHLLVERALASATGAAVLGSEEKTGVAFRAGHGNRVASAVQV